MNRSPRPFRAADVDPRLDAALRYALAIGAVLVLLLPAARDTQAAVGWLPLWLLAMPATAWWALHGFRLPRATPVERPVVARTQRAMPQARRRARNPRRDELPRAA